MHKYKLILLCAVSLLLCASCDSQTSSTTTDTPEESVDMPHRDTPPGGAPF